MTGSSLVKYSSLALLTVQNSLLILTLRYSRNQHGPQYLTSTVVLLSELLKAFLSFIAYTIIRYSTSRPKATSSDEGKTLLSQPFETVLEPRAPHEWFVQAVPLLMSAVLYTIQNNLQLIAMSHLEAATFQVLYQGKILTTAVCMVMFLGKRLSTQRCAAIVLLTIGISCASIPQGPAKTLSLTMERNKQNHALGVAAVGAACVLSGMAGVITEMTLKKTQRQSDRPARGFWLRNIQLSIMSVIFAIPGVLLLDRKQLQQRGFFQGYNKIVVVAIFLQAIGGLVVALVVTNADNILKGFATSVSVLMSAGISILLDSPITPLFTLGLCCVISASCLYATKEDGEKLSNSVDSKTKGEIVFLA